MKILLKTRFVTSCCTLQSLNFIGIPTSQTVLSAYCLWPSKSAVIIASILEARLQWTSTQILAFSTQRIKWLKIHWLKVCINILYSIGMVYNRHCTCKYMSFKLSYKPLGFMIFKLNLNTCPTVTLTSAGLVQTPLQLTNQMDCLQVTNLSGHSSPISFTDQALQAWSCPWHTLTDQCTLHRSEQRGTLPLSAYNGALAFISPSWE